MHRRARALTWRNLLVPGVLILLGAASIAAISALQARADDARTAELQLSALKVELVTLQNAPFTAISGVGGSPQIAGGLLMHGKRQIAATLLELQRNDPPQSLERVPGRLRVMNAALDRIYRIGVSTNTFGPRADRLAGVAARSQGQITVLLDQAAAVYRGRAGRAERESTVGAAVAIVLLLCAFALLYRKNRTLLEVSRHEARFDALTGLRNRRALVLDLADGVARASAERPLLLGLLDLDGFKQYNDTFGHPAGDALLTRLGVRLQQTLNGVATAYRMGGDEFCLLADAGPEEAAAIERRAIAALSESGDSFRISCSFGSAQVPSEASSAETALHLADQRMYAQKLGTLSAERQSGDVLLQVLVERSDSLDLHVSSVGRLARLVAGRLGLSAHEQDRIQVAAQLHDIGKTAIPDSLLHKPGALTAEEWSFMHQHTVIGERILLAAPALAETAALVRSSHERIDGHGYPDGLAGEQIPIGSRIIAVCDAFDAMVAQRTYRAPLTPSAARAELRRGAGSQFDANVVGAFIELSLDTQVDEPGRAA